MSFFLDGCILTRFSILAKTNLSHFSQQRTGSRLRHRILLKKIAHLCLESRPHRRVQVAGVSSGATLPAEAWQGSTPRRRSSSSSIFGSGGGVPDAGAASHELPYTSCARGCCLCRHDVYTRNNTKQHFPLENPTGRHTGRKNGVRNTQTWIRGGDECASPDASKQTTKITVSIRNPQKMDWTSGKT